MLLLGHGPSVSPVHAQTGTLQPAPASAGTPGELMALNSYEISLLRLIPRKAQNGSLREHAAMMLKDHQLLNTMLTALANKKQTGSAASLTHSYTDRFRQFEVQSPGDPWDRAIVEELISNHRLMATLLESLGNDRNDKEYAQLAKQQLPVVQKHLDMLILLRSGSESLSVPPVTPTVSVSAAGGSDKDAAEKDAKFLTDFMVMNHYAYSLAEMILKKGNHRDLKDAAQRLLEDHRQLSDRATAYATARQLPMEWEKGNDMAEKLAKWEGKRGGMEWDADMIEELIDAHKDGADMLEDARNDVRNQELKLLFTEALSAMRTHLDMFATLKEKVKKPWKK